MPVAGNYKEADLVLLLKQRNPAAFDYLYEQYAAALYAVILNIITDRETASDILQDVFVKIWKQADQYDQAKGRLFTWMLNISRNASIDFTRSKQFKNSRKHVEVSDAIHPLSHNLLSNTDGIGIAGIVKRLPDEYGKLITLAYFRGYTYDEIAKEQNIPLGTVKTRIRKALIALKQLL